MTKDEIRAIVRDEVEERRRFTTPASGQEQSQTQQACRGEGGSSKFQGCRSKGPPPKSQIINVITPRARAHAGRGGLTNLHNLQRQRTAHH
jgi:hypothetical protein